LPSQLSPFPSSGSSVVFHGSPRPIPPVDSSSFLSPPFSLNSPAPPSYLRSGLFRRLPPFSPRRDHRRPYFPDLTRVPPPTNYPSLLYSPRKMERCCLTSPPLSSPRQTPRSGFHLSLSIPPPEMKPVLDVSNHPSPQKILFSYFFP